MDTLTRFSPPGRCIYCNATGTLTDEHVIPAGLKGDCVLPRSSCEACQKLTSKAELHCLREIFGLMRSTTGIQSARRKKTRKSSLTVTETENGSSSTVELPWDAVPASFLVLRLPPPALITKAPETKGWPAMRIDIVTIQSDFATRLRALNANWSVAHRIHPTKFSSMLAKIAFSYAVGQLGVDGFIPLVRDLCLLKESAPWKYVGDEWMPVERENGDALHRLHLRIDSGYLVARVHLFAQFGLNPYAVVVGVPT
ncbi:hypothetical protein OKW37_008168 [Paraburkholderia sp. MM5482-R2]